MIYKRHFCTSINTKDNLITDIGLLTSDTGGFYINSQHDAKLVNGVVAYNTIAGLMTSGDYLSGIYFDNGTSGGLIHHNVVDAAGNTNVKRVIKLSGGSDFKVYNNSATGGSTTTINAGKDCVVLNNLVTGVIKGGDTVSNNLMAVVAAQNFVDAGAGDFRLIEASPAINAGVVIPGITDGYVGDAPDIGAYEFGVNAPYPVRPSDTGGNWKPSK